MTHSDIELYPLQVDLTPPGCPPRSCLSKTKVFVDNTACEKKTQQTLVISDFLFNLKSAGTVGKSNNSGQGWVGNGNFSTSQFV